MARHKKTAKIVGLFIGSVILVLVIRYLGVESVWSVMRSIPPSIVTLLVVIQIVALGLSALKLFAFLPQIHLRKLNVLVARAALLSTAAPTGAAEGGLAYLLTREGVDWRRATEAIVCDRIVSSFMIVLAVIAAAARLAIFESYVSSPVLLSVAMPLALASGAALVYRFRPGEWRRFSFNFLITGVRAFVWGLSYFLVFRASGATAGSYIDFVILPIAARILGFIPIPAGLGISEGSLAAVFTLVGVAPHVTVAALLAERVAVLLGTAIAAALPLRTATALDA